MAIHIITFVCFVIMLALMMLSIGKEIERNKIRDISRGCADKGQIQERIDARKKENDGSFMFIIFFVAINLTLFAGTYFDWPNFYINKFKEGKIVENVNYNYQKINGEKVLKDSTITYVPYKEKK